METGPPERIVRLNDTLTPAKVDAFNKMTHPLTEGGHPTRCGLRSTLMVGRRKGVESPV